MLLHLLIPLLPLSLATFTTTHFATPCYTLPLPSPPSSHASSTPRSTPWGTPSLLLKNGSTCCTSLPQIRSGIDDIDTQLLSLLALRAGFVREATRFKSTLSEVDVPSRDEEVIQGAVNASRGTEPRLPEIIAKRVFEAIINASVPFEQCIFEEFCGRKKA